MVPTAGSSAGCQCRGSFAGLVWSADGKRLFAGGGFDDLIYRFDHADGLLSKKAGLRISRSASNSWPESNPE